MSERAWEEEDVLVSASATTHRGQVRLQNQDCLLVAQLGGPSADAPSPGDGSAEVSVGPLRFVLADEGVILLVADGMGGRAGGAEASRLAVTAVRDALLGQGPTAGCPPHEVGPRLARALETANATIHDSAAGGDGPPGMGSTATLAGLFDGMISVAQVGDSRAYLVRRSRIGRLTKDQSLAQSFVDSGVLSEEEADNVPNNVVLQALGTEPTVHPEVTSCRLRRGDVVVLCSDGLSQLVSDDEILMAVERSEGEDAVCRVLVGLANERGAPDNVTVVVAGVGGTGIEEATEGDSIGPRIYEQA